MPKHTIRKPDEATCLALGQPAGRIKWHAIALSGANHDTLQRLLENRTSKDPQMCKGCPNETNLPADIAAPVTRYYKGLWPLY